jgi:hypothetical protein
MGAPVASGTLPGSRSGSWARIHKPPPAASHPSVAPYSRTTRTTLSNVAESAAVDGHDFRNREKQQLQIGITAVRDSSVRQAPRREPRSSLRSRRLDGAHNSVIASGHGHAVARLSQPVALRKHARRQVRRSGAAKAIMRPASCRRDRRDSDSDVAEGSQAKRRGSMEAIVSSDHRRRMNGAAPAVEGPLLDHA